MRKIPKSIKEYTANARYYLESAKKFPTPTCDAVKILLLLTAKENIKIAEEMLSIWIRKDKQNKKLFKSHQYKFSGSKHSIERIVFNKNAQQKETISYKTGHQFKELYQICKYGLKNGSKDISSIFKRGWDSESFEIGLYLNVKHMEEKLEEYEKLLAK